MLTAAMLGLTLMSATPTSIPQYRNGNTLCGIDVLARDGFKALQGKRVGLITNQTGLTRDGRRNIDAMVAGQPEVRRYRMRYLDGDDPVGVWSAVVSVTTIP